jgi:[CysO sulfur-carrier protein]-S-L-cysteine hydrolase
VKIRLPPSLQQRLKDELARAKLCEVGGLLMAEHLGNDDYRIVDLSVQRGGGSAACFIRHPKKHRAHLERFFERTGHNYQRFNYFGEWHSHPSFATTPSIQDLRTMQALVCDPAVGANFLALLVVRLDPDATLDSSATVFRADGAPARGDLTMEPTETNPNVGEITTVEVGPAEPERDDPFARPTGNPVHDKEGE